MRSGNERSAARPALDIDEVPMADAPPPELPVKKDVLLAMLAEGPVMLFLDGRREGVALPPLLCGDPHVRLDVGYDMAVPIPDLEITEAHLRATLSFARTPFTCVIPWGAIFAMHSCATEEGLLWPQDVPEEVLAQLASATAPTLDRRGASHPEPRPRPGLRAVRDDDTPPPAPTPPRRGAQLRLVK